MGAISKILGSIFFLRYVLYVIITPIYVIIALIKVFRNGKTALDPNNPKHAALIKELEDTKQQLRAEWQKMRAKLKEPLIKSKQK